VLVRESSCSIFFIYVWRALTVGQAMGWRVSVRSSKQFAMQFSLSSAVVALVSAFWAANSHETTTQLALERSSTGGMACGLQSCVNLHARSRLLTLLRTSQS
jgi:hypothetical protein